MPRIDSNKAAAHHVRVESPTPHWAKKVEADIQDRLSNSDVGIDESEVAQKDLGKFPDEARKLYFAQQTDARDNDGQVRAYEFPIDKKHSGFAVRWTSEDGQLDRIYLFNSQGKSVSTGHTDDAGTDLSWKKGLHLSDGPWKP
jgi:hypothetical protein